VIERGEIVYEGGVQEISKNEEINKLIRGY